MKTLLPIVGWFLAGLIALIIITQAGNFIGLWNIKFWGVKYEDARRGVFEQSKAFRDGANRDLMELCLQWNTATDNAAKDLIASTINQRRLTIPDSALTANTTNCLNGVY